MRRPISAASPISASAHAEHKQWRSESRTPPFVCDGACPARLRFASSHVRRAALRCTGWLAPQRVVSVSWRGDQALLSSRVKPSSLAGRSHRTREGRGRARNGCNLFDFLFPLIKPPARQSNAKSLAATPPPALQTAPPFPHLIGPLRAPPPPAPR